MNIFYKAGYSAFVQEIFLVNILLITFIAQLDVNSGIQERLLSQPCFKNGEIINICFAEYLGVSFKCNLGAAI